MYNYEDPTQLWSDSIDLSGISDDDIRSYFNDFGVDYKAPSDARLATDVAKAKTNALSSGNQKLANTLDFIMKYGDKALSILARNGIIKNQNLIQGGYSIDFDALSKVSTTGTTNNAPEPDNRVFNLDFSDPKVLIITFLVVMALFYFLFFNKSNNGKSR